MDNPRHIRPPRIPACQVLQLYAKYKQTNREQVFCIQVGANDGKTTDPVFRFFDQFGWNGLLVEPQEDVYEQQLKKTYAHRPELILENVAIGPSGKSLPFYRLNCSDANWATGLATFNKEVLLAHVSNGYIEQKAQEDGILLGKELIETTMIPTVSFNDLIERHSIDRVDVLCIDAEGADFEVLEQFDFEQYKPDLVLYESKHLLDSDYVSSKALLSNAGYRLFWDAGDTLAVRSSVLTYPITKLRIATRWSRLRKNFSIKSDHKSFPEAVLPPKMAG